jgi:hypothetical protein
MGLACMGDAGIVTSKTFIDVAFLYATMCLSVILGVVRLLALA